MSFDKVKVDTKSKAMEGGDYRSVNPLGYVPALELDDGTILTEGPAIVQYIADKVPDKKLAPANGTLERTKLQSWLNFISTRIAQGLLAAVQRRHAARRPSNTSASGSPRASNISISTWQTRIT